jgi:predicted deacylase
MPTRTVETLDLPAASMGGTRRLTVIRYGHPSTGPKAYLQAGLHADEPPGHLVMHHLQERLDRADAAGDLRGEILLVPVANPIGAAQWHSEALQGRFDRNTHINFNREHTDLTAQIAEKIEGRLGSDPAGNTALIRQAAGDLLAAAVPVDEARFLKQRLLALSHDADIVLDLHCDFQAVLHVYLGTPLWPAASDLCRQLGAEVILLAEHSGVTPFDEACSRIWWQLADRFPEHPIPAACLAATVELRGIADVDHSLAEADADNLFRFLQRRGVVQGQAPPLPPLRRDATPLAGVEHITASGAGVVVFHKAPGDRVHPGEVVAEVINPLRPVHDGGVVPLSVTTEGILFARRADRFARPGLILAKVAGRVPLKQAGEILLPL